MVANRALCPVNVKKMADKSAEAFLSYLCTLYPIFGQEILGPFLCWVYCEVAL